MSIVTVTGHEIPISILQSHLVRHFSPPNHYHFTSDSTTSSKQQHNSLRPTTAGDDLRNDILLHLPRLFIDNPYFQAWVHLKVEQSDETTRNSLLLQQKEKEEVKEEEEEVDKQDGILLIFHHESTSMDTLTEMHNRILGGFSSSDTHPQSSERQTQDDSLRLCISTSSQTIPSSKENEEIYSQRVLWCLDRGYEYIEVDLSEDGMRVKPEVREKDGFDRVVEAIGSTVWKSAVMKTRSTSSTTSSRRWITMNDSRSSDGCVEAQTIGASTCWEEENDATIKEANLNTWSGNNEESNNSYTTNSSTTITNQETQQEIREGALLMDQFEQLLKEARIIRDASKSGALSDQERKDRAGNAAQMLMGLLNEMGFDDDDDDDEEVESGDSEGE